MSSTIRSAACFLTLVAVLGGAAALADNNPPEVSNVTASQRTDDSRLVDIYYDLADADGDACTVSVQASDDGGASWNVRIQTLSGHVGSGISPGTGKHIVWDCAKDLPCVVGTLKVRILADDGQGAGGGMVFVPGGSFEMGDSFNEGDDDELPVHTVYLSPYHIDTYEVTNQQYAAGLNWAWGQGGLIHVSGGVVYQYPGTSYPYCDTYSYDDDSRIHWDGSSFTVTPGKEDHPMVEVSWYGSVAYCNWRSAMAGKPLCYDLSTWECNFGVAGCRLPTEAEWEKAAGWDPVQQRHFRFGEHSDGCGYNCLDGQRANYSASGDPYEVSPWPYTTPVGFYNGELHDKADFGWPGSHETYQTQDAQSYYRCRDMSGNVREWCNDRYSSTYYSSSAPSNPTGPTSGTDRVVRGGSWDFNPSNCRSADRLGGSFGSRDKAGGFRCASGTPSGRATAWGESSEFAIDNEAPGVDLAIEAEDVVLVPNGDDVDATITVHNLGAYEAVDVTVEVFKRSAGGFVWVGSDGIPSIQGCLDESAVVTFTPDFLGQEIKVVASLPNQANDVDPSNNEVIVTWNGGVDEPVVLEIEAEYDGNDQPDVAGRYIADVELNNGFYATVLEGGSR